MPIVEYNKFMSPREPHVVLTLDLSKPVELTDFVGTYLSLSSQFDTFVRSQRPDLSSDAKVYVTEVKPGSIVSVLVPFLATIDVMDKALIIEQFIKLYGSRLKKFFEKGGRLEGGSRRDLKDLIDGVRAVANDSNGSQKLEAVYFEDDKRRVRAAMTFASGEAKIAIKEIEAQKRELKETGYADHERVLMYFKRSDMDDVSVGKPSGERVVIEEISEKDLPLVYASELAEERIKYEIRESDENIFKKGFVVDVNIQTRAGRPVAYGVKEVHQIISLDNQS